MNFKEIKNQIKKEGRLFDDQLIECAKNNYNKGRLSALKDEEEFLKKWINVFEVIIMEEGLKEQMLQYLNKRLSQIQKEIKEIENV